MVSRTAGAPSVRSVDHVERSVSPPEHREFPNGDAVVRFLTAQHRRITHLFEQTGKSWGDERRERFRTLRWTLATHETVEQAVVHPCARRAPGLDDDWVRARMGEETEVRQTLRRLERLPATLPEFDALLNDLQTDVLRHYRVEEAEEFPAVAHRLGNGDLHRIESAVRIAQPVSIDDTYAAMVEYVLAELRASRPDANA